jgi:hypothetical protein
MKVTAPEAIHLQRVNWAIEFSETDLSSLGASELDNLRLKLFEFISDSHLQKGGIANDGQRLDVSPLPLKEFLPLMTGHRLKQIRDDLKKALAQFADESFFSIKPTTEKSGAAWISWGSFTPGNRFFRFVNVPGDPATQTLVALGLHVEQSNLTAERIRRCPRCSTIFVRERKPKEGEPNQYCRRACAQAAANAAYRAAAKQKRQRRKRRASV